MNNMEIILIPFIVTSKSVKNVEIRLTKGIKLIL